MSDNPAVVRRLHAPALYVGEILLAPAQARHARDALRLGDGDTVEIFDDRGAVAIGTLVFRGGKDAAVRVAEIAEPASGQTLLLIVASAVPKGERADWMVEKLSELGVSAWVPLATDRSVVKPEGRNKYERWTRIATESAKQSHRSGVMRIEELRPLKDLLKQLAGPLESRAIHLSTEPGAQPLARLLPRGINSLLLLIGPEGGWTEAELSEFAAQGIEGARLTSTILRVETAAITAAAVALCHQI